MPTRAATQRYLAFDADLAGLNNNLMQLEIMVVLAWLTARTLVLPPGRLIHPLGPEPHSLQDFIDLDVLQKYLDVVTAEQFTPPLKTTKAFHEYMRKTGHAPGWNALEDVLLYPSSAVTDRLELIPRLYARRCVGITEAADTCEVLYFPCTGRQRMFGVFEAFFLFGDPKNERLARALVRDALQYRPEVLRLAEQAISTTPLANLCYSAMHIRRGDSQFPITWVSAPEILRHTENLVPAGEALYLATDESDPEFLQPFRERWSVVQFKDLAPEVVKETPLRWIGIVETLICASAPQLFIGTRLSTFSARIATIRGHWSHGSGRHAGIDATLYYTQAPLWAATADELRPYASPCHTHTDKLGETATPWWLSAAREPIWGRAYEAVWADTGATPFSRTDRPASGFSKNGLAIS